MHTGDTFNIKIRPDVSGFPEKQATGNGLAPQATVYNIWGSASGYQLPAGLAINNVTLGPVDGSVGTNPDAGYYVSNTNVPQVTNGYNVGPDPTFDPLTLAPSKLVAIPGVAPDAYWNTSTNRVYTTLLGSNAAGTSSTGEFHGGSMVQGPTVTVSVTATANPVTNLAVTLAGSLPAGSFTGSQPGNFPAPVNGSTGGSLASTTATSPWSSTDGKRWVYSNGGQWTDPTYTTTATANALLTVSAAAACAPGWESNTDTPTEPSYYLGVNAIPNGTSPPLSSTTVDGIGVNAPFDGAHYLTGQSVNADYSCQVSSQVGNYDTCVGDLAEGAAIDTSTPGSYTFTVNANGREQRSGLEDRQLHGRRSAPAGCERGCGADREAGRRGGDARRLGYHRPERAAGYTADVYVGPDIRPDGDALRCPRHQADVHGRAGDDFHR